MIKEQLNRAIDLLKNPPFGNKGFKLKIDMPQTVKDKGDKFLIETSVNIWHEYKKNKPDLEVLHKVYNIDCIVMGGSPELPEDFKKVYSDMPPVILIAANHHAFHLRDTDFMCFLDPWDRVSPLFKEVYKKSKATKISLCNLDYTDYYCVNESEFHDRSDSGIWAAWFASFITTGDIYLCGFNLGQSEPRHFYDSGVVGGWGGKSIDKKLNDWKDLKNGIENKLIPVSGILKEHL